MGVQSCRAYSRWPVSAACLGVALAETEALAKTEALAETEISNNGGIPSENPIFYLCYSRVGA